MIASPLQRVVIAKDLPGARAALIESLAAAESQARELIAETAILIPPFNRRAAIDAAVTCRDLLTEVSDLLRHQDQLDHRWILHWEQQPSWVRPQMWQPLTKAALDLVTRYMALEARRLSEMIAFLEGGSDKPVRHAEIWAAAAPPRDAGRQAA